MKFNEKLIKLRKSNGYTQEELAEKLGVSRQAVARWEAGETTPEMAMLIGLCKAFEVSADYLIRDEVETVNDIPIIREKNCEIDEAKEKKRLGHLLSGILFAFSTACFIVATCVTAYSPALPLLVIADSASAAACVGQLVCYFRMK